MAARDPASGQPAWRRYLRFHGPDVAADVEDELSFHLAMLEEEYVAEGRTREEARRAARMRFGSYPVVERECLEIGEESIRMMRRDAWWQDVRLDVRHSVRSLLNTPGFTLATVLVLALGIGANAQVFSVIDSVLLRPLPYEQPESLVRVFETFPLAGGSSGEGSVSYPNFEDWREQSRSFRDLALAGFRTSLTLQGQGDAERIAAVPVGGNLFSLLGVNPVAGRGFASGDDEPGAPAVVVLSDEAWRNRFGSDASVLGSTLVLDGEPHTVVGVMPREFRYPAGGGAPDVWVPLRPGEQQRRNRGSHAFTVVGRLAPGVTVEAAEREMRAIAAGIADRFPDQQEGRSAVVRSLHEQVVGDIRPTLLVLLGAAALVLLIACANVASLLLARSVARQREVAIRSALGAGRRRIVQRFLIESLLLVFAGAAVGLLLAEGGLRAIRTAAGSLLPRATEISIDLRVVLVLLAVSLVIGSIFGLIPAAQSARLNLQQALREGGRTGSGGRAGQLFRSTLVVVQVALSLVLLVGAGLLMRTFLALLGTDSGMATENVLTARLALPAQKYETAAGASSRFYEPVLERIRGLPGVSAAGMINMLPLQGWGFNGNFGIAGKSFESVAEQPFAEFRLVSPGYFAALGIPLLRGRDVTEQDSPEAPPVVLVNQAMADRYFAGEDAVGQQIVGMGPTPITIVGVVGDVRQAGLDSPPRAELYFPQPQVPFAWQEMTLVVRTGMKPMALAGPVREAIRAIDPQQPVFDLVTMDQVVAESVSDRRLYLWLMGVFALVALTLAVTGIYGVISYSVSQRTREFGIRLALGSSARRLRRGVVWQGGRLALWGLLIGIPASYLLTRLLAGLLYGVGAADPLTYAGVALVLGVVALLASYVPALRATRVDPIVALRAE